MSCFARADLTSGMLKGHLFTGHYTEVRKIGVATMGFSVMPVSDNLAFGILAEDAHDDYDQCNSVMPSKENSNKVRGVSRRLVFNIDDFVTEMARSIYDIISQEKMELLAFLKTNEELRMNADNKSHERMQEKIEVS